MAGEWRKSKLGSLIDIEHGFAFKGEHFRDEPPGDILLTPGNFAIGGGFKDDKFKYYDGPVPEEFILQEGDLLVTMTDLSRNGDTLGYPAIVPPVSGQQRYLHNQRLGKIIITDTRELHPRFLFYVLCTREYRHEIIARATGTTVKHTSPSRIKEFETSIPPFDAQQAIGCILGSLDDKIDLNRRMNQSLEATARAIFKSWFVDFDPVRARAEGRAPRLPRYVADLFPTSLVKLELEEIPNGWSVGTLGDIAENQRRGVDPNEIEPSTPYFGLEHMPRRCIALSEWGHADALESNKFEFEQGEILFGKLRPYFHKVGVAPVSGVCSTDILVVAPKTPEWFGFVLGHVSSTDFVQHTNASSTGTKMPRTSWQEMARYKVAVPPKPIAARFDKTIRPLVARITANIHESRTLAALREALLPKLISGELAVPDAERIVRRCDGNLTQ